MTDPKRFIARLDDESVLAASNEPKEAQDAAEAYAEKHPTEGVHLYQHVLTVQRSADGN